MGDAEIMGMITALQSDPQVKAALADPEFMHLVVSANLGALQSNRRLNALMSSPGLGVLQGRRPGSSQHRSPGYGTEPPAPQPMTTHSSGNGCLNSPPSRAACQRRP